MTNEKENLKVEFGKSFLYDAVREIQKQMLREKYLDTILKQNNLYEKEKGATRN